MNIREFFALIFLLIKYRSMFSVSHRKRDLIDEIVLDCMQHMRGLAFTPGATADDASDIPF